MLGPVAVGDAQTARPAALLARGTLLTLLLLGGAILLWVCGDTLSGAAVRHWLQTQTARQYAAGWIALWGLALACATGCLSTFAARRRCWWPALGLSWLMRWTLLIEVQTVPKYNASYSPIAAAWYRRFAGDRRHFGLWLALMIMVREAQAFLLRRKQHG